MNELSWEQKHNNLEILYHRVLAEKTAALAENEELKQWMSDACELLHDIRSDWGIPLQDQVGYDTDALLALLRRAENP